MDVCISFYSLPHGSTSPKKGEKWGNRRGFLSKYLSFLSLHFLLLLPKLDLNRPPGLVEPCLFRAIKTEHYVPTLPGTVSIQLFSSEKEKENRRENGQERRKSSKI
jgi:hypothetical protein